MRYLRSTLQATKLLLRKPLGDSGAVMVEFAFILPLLVLLLVGTILFGLAVLNYGIVTQVAGAGARQLAVSRGDAKPFSDTESVIINASASLSAVHLEYKMYVDGTPCSSDGACSALLGGVDLSASPPPTAQVIVTYPCNPITFGTSIEILGHSYGHCTLEAQMTEAVE